MADNFFDGLMKGFSSFMPQDDPDTKVFQTMNELNDLKKRETELYVEIGKRVYPNIVNQAEYAPIIQELQQNKIKQTQVQETMNQAKKAKEDKQKQEEEAIEARTCPNCDSVNPEGTKFCQECGARLGEASKCICPKCGMKNPPQTRFCGECGTKLA